MQKVTLGDVAAESKETCKKDQSDYPTVGLEHLTPGELSLSRWDENSDTTFTKLFRKGDMLFGRRRAYLKKAAVAPFDGICSGDITVIRALPGKIVPELLPFIIQSEDFFDFAVGHSAGSLSPRVKWEHLKNYRLTLPPLAKQRELAEVLWAIEDTRTAYQRLEQATEELVKSRFIEMFGDLAFNPMNWQEMTLMEACVDKDDIKCGPFGTQLGKHEYRRDGVPLWGIPQINAAFAIPPTDFISVEKAEQLSSYSLLPGDIAMSRKGNVGKCAIYPEGSPKGIIHSDVLRIRVDTEICNPVFLMCQLHFSRAISTQIDTVSSGAIMAGINVTKLKKILVYLPPIALQNQFADFVALADKSKLTSQSMFERISAIKAAVMQEWLVD